MAIDPRYTKLRWWREALGGRWRTQRARLGFRGPYVFDKVHEGEPMRFFIADPAAEAWYGRRSDPHDLEMRFVRREMLRPGSVVFECGAHHGHDTVLLARWVGESGKVVAFEPIAANVEVIAKNLGLNGVTNATVVRAAVGATSGEVAMAADGNSHVLDAEASGEAAVPLVSIDDYCAKHDVVPDLIKVDVEGFEWEVLKGARRTLAEHRPMLQLEVHGDQLFRYGTEAAALWSLVDAQDCDVWVQRDDRRDPEPAAPGVALAGRVHVYLRPRERARA